MLVVTSFISFLNAVELVVCNGRQLVLEPEWTKVRPSLDPKVGDRFHCNRCAVDEGGRRGECTVFLRLDAHLRIVAPL